MCGHVPGPPAAAPRDRQLGDTCQPPPGPRASKQASVCSTGEDGGTSTLLGREDVQEMLRHAWGNLDNFYIIPKTNKQTNKKSLCFYYKRDMSSGREEREGHGTQRGRSTAHRHWCWTCVCPGASLTTPCRVLYAESRVAMTSQIPRVQPFVTSGCRCHGSRVSRTGWLS